MLVTHPVIWLVSFHVNHAASGKQQERFTPVPLQNIRNISNILSSLETSLFYTTTGKSCWTNDSYQPTSRTTAGWPTFYQQPPGRAMYVPTNRRLS